MNFAYIFYDCLYQNRNLLSLSIQVGVFGGFALVVHIYITYLTCLFQVFVEILLLFS